MMPLIIRLRRAALLPCALAILSCLFASRAEAATRLTPLLSGLSYPVYVTSSGDSRLFIVEQGGRIRIYNPALGTLLPTPFLDISALVAFGGEQGLLSMAFHPDYASNGFFFVNYTNVVGNTVIARYRVSGNANQADPGSGVTLLQIAQPFDNHNGGQLQIGPDGHLYIGMGDGGAGGDPDCNAQNGSSLLGKMLRLNIRANLSTPPYYAIPSDNPFRSNNDPTNVVPDEIWALGLRNPWRFSFDRLTGDLFIGDVGQEEREEIDLQRRGEVAGKNFGWRVMEGTRCYSPCPGAPACNSTALRLPVHEYSHASGGCSVTGGYVARSARAPELSGRYVFGDYCSGRIEALRETSPGVFTSQLLVQAPNVVISFGEGHDGRLFLIAGDGLYEVVSDAVPVPSGATFHLSALFLALLLCALWFSSARKNGHGPRSLALSIQLMIFAVASLLSSAAEARSFRVGQIPNGSINGCANCHISGNGGPRNPFGAQIEALFLSTPGPSGNVLWGSALAAADADGDGRSNGQELQDPTGAWSFGQPAPGTPGLVTLPGTPNPGAVAVPALSDLWCALLALSLLLVGASPMRARRFRLLIRYFSRQPLSM